MGDSQILFVDDDREELSVALRAFRRAGLSAEVSVAHDGQEALELLGLENGDGSLDPMGVPAVVFLDRDFVCVHSRPLIRLIRSFELLSADPRSGERVLAIREADGGMEIDVTHADLARRLAKFIHHAFEGILDHPPMTSETIDGVALADGRSAG